jgi:peptidoglycan/xylan/chitin deacetylase (PgdA/CDA1 family)
MISHSPALPLSPSRLFWYPPILTYHRVQPNPEPSTPTVTPEVFKRQMQLLAERWKPTSLGDLVETLEENRPLSKQSVVVTFDDGTEDTFTHALPILQEYHIPAAVFVIAGNVGKPGWLRPEQLKKIRQAGITIGSHGLSHDYLPELPLARAEESLSTSKELLRKTIGEPVDWISYPAGGYTPEILKVVRSFGYRGACTTNRGTKRFPVNRWALRRLTMHSGATSAAGLWIRCCGYYGLNKRLRKPW